MVERELIAERTIYAVDKDSRGFEIRLMIGKPYPMDSELGNWACPVAMIGLHGGFPDIQGADSWQALTLAQQPLRVLVTFFVEDGGKLFWEENGVELTVEELFSGMSRKTPEDLISLTQEEYLANIDSLTPAELQRIDDALMSGASTQFRKVARVVGIAMTVTKNPNKRIPDDFYASRVRKLVEDGRLIAEGNLDYMRYSEVKLPE
jgi:hypothetical protein